MRLQQRHQALIPSHYKTLALFSLHSAGIAGGLTRAASALWRLPSLPKSVEILLWLFWWHVGSMFGPVVSATVLTVPEALRALC